MKLTPICLAVLATQSSVSLGDLVNYGFIVGTMELTTSYEGTDWGPGGVDINTGFDSIDQFGGVTPGVYTMDASGSSASVGIEAKSMSVSSTLYSSSSYYGNDAGYWESIATSGRTQTTVSFSLDGDTAFALSTMFSASSGTGSYELRRTTDDTTLYSGSSAAGTVNTDMEIELGAGSYFFILIHTVATDHVYENDVYPSDESHISGSLRVVPAPGSLALLMGGGLVMGRRRR